MASQHLKTYIDAASVCRGDVILVGDSPREVKSVEAEHISVVLFWTDSRLTPLNCTSKTKVAVLI